MQYTRLKAIFLLNKGLKNFRRKERLPHFNLKSLYVLNACYLLFEQHKIITASQVNKQLRKDFIFMQHQEIVFNLHQLKENNYLTSTKEKRRAFISVCYKVQPSFIILLNNLNKQLNQTRL